MVDYRGFLNGGRQGNDTFFIAIVAMNEAAEFVGLYYGLVQRFNLFVAKGVMQQQKAWNPKSREALSARHRAFNEMDLPLVEELKKMADDLDISRLKDLLTTD